jgi:hypothetical protein
MIAPALFLASMGLTAMFAALLWREAMSGELDGGGIGIGKPGGIQRSALWRLALLEPEGRMAILAAAISLAIVCLR